MGAIGLAIAGCKGVFAYFVSVVIWGKNRQPSNRARAILIISVSSDFTLGCLVVRSLTVWGADVHGRRGPEGRDYFQDSQFLISVLVHLPDGNLMNSTPSQPASSIAFLIRLVMTTEFASGSNAIMDTCSISDSTM